MGTGNVVDNLDARLSESDTNQLVFIFVMIFGISVLFLIIYLIVTSINEKRDQERRRQQDAYRQQLIQEFQNEFGVVVPWDVTLERLSAPTSCPEYVLAYPSWEYACADGTRDRRYKHNPLVGHTSKIFYSKWHITCDNPISMNQLVVAMRKKGAQVPLCVEEREKRSRLRKTSQNRFEGASAFQLYARFMNDSDGFEEWCADLVRQTGADVTVTPSTNDGGYDLDIKHNGKRTLAECKCYNPKGSKVGRPLLQKLVGANAAVHADKLLFMTTSSFSGPAIEYAREQHMTLMDGKRLIKLDAKRRNNTKSNPVPKDAWYLTDEDIMSMYPADIAS